MAALTVTVHFYHDITCPWSLIGKKRLEGPPTAHDARSEATRNMVIAGRIERLKQVAREEGVELSLRTHPSLPPVSSTPGVPGHAEPDPLNRPSTVMAHTAVAWVAEEARRGVGEGCGDGRTGEGEGGDMKENDGGHGRGKLLHSRDKHTMDNRDKTTDWSFTKMLNRAVKSLARRGRGRPKSGPGAGAVGPRRGDG
ncbi:hypothetical protein HDU93_002378, partial [Gonapodya sp. JEL0774]